VRPPLHPEVHCEPEQTCPEVQALPHAPQWAGSALVSTQDPEHAVEPAGQLDRHWAWEQTSPLAQALPHAPQFFGSLSVAVQVPLQLSSLPQHALEQLPS